MQAVHACLRMMQLVQQLLACYGRSRGGFACANSPRKLVSLRLEAADHEMTVTWRRACHGRGRRGVAPVAEQVADGAPRKAGLPAAGHPAALLVQVAGLHIAHACE